MERECGVLLAVDGAVRAELAKVANGVHELEDLMGCELGPGHAGPHEALGQTAGDGTDYWLRWSDGRPCTSRSWSRARWSQTAATSACCRVAIRERTDSEPLLIPR